MPSEAVLQQIEITEPRVVKRHVDDALQPVLN